MPETDGNARSVMLVNDTRPDRHYGCQAVVEGLLVFLARAGLRIPSFHPVGKPWTADPTFHERIAQVSAVIVNGEGSIHHSNARAQALAQIGSLCRQTLRIPSVALNATLEANDARIYKHLAQFDLVSVRDRKSFEEVEAFGLAKPLYCPDFSMYHDFASARSEPAAEAPTRIGITDSIIPRVTQQLTAMKSERGYVSCDIRIGANQPNSTIYDYASRMASLDLLVTGRYHAVCFAINTKTPFVAIESNTRKISNLLSDIFGDTRRVIAADDVRSLRVEDFAGWSAKESDDLERFRLARPGYFAELSRAVAEVTGKPTAV